MSDGQARGWKRGQFGILLFAGLLLAAMLETHDNPLIVYLRLPFAHVHDLAPSLAWAPVVVGIAVFPIVRHGARYADRRYRWRRRPALYASSTNADLELQELGHLAPDLNELVHCTRRARIWLRAHAPLNATSERPSLRVMQEMSRLSDASARQLREAGLTPQPVYEAMAAASGHAWFEGLMTLDAALQHLESQIIRHCGEQTYR